jgi:thiamine monophosphate kinase
LALGGGEDYELLFTLRPAGLPAKRLARRLGVAVTEIGRVRKGRAGGRSRAVPVGWQHF